MDRGLFGETEEITNIHSGQPDTRPRFAQYTPRLQNQVALREHICLSPQRNDILGTQYRHCCSSSLLFGVLQEILIGTGRASVPLRALTNWGLPICFFHILLFPNCEVVNLILAKRKGALSTGSPTRRHFLCRSNSETKHTLSHKLKQQYRIRLRESKLVQIYFSTHFRDILVLIKCKLFIRLVLLGKLIQTRMECCRIT